MNTSSGAEWAYFMDAFGAPPAFLFSWVSTLVLKPSQMAIICLSFAQYAVEAFVHECEPPIMAIKMVALLAIGNHLINHINFVQLQFRITESINLNMIFIYFSLHFVCQLLQCQFGHGCAEYIYSGQNGCGIGYYFGRCIQTISGQCTIFAKCIYFTDAAIRCDSSCILYGFVGIRWLE